VVALLEREMEIKLWESYHYRGDYKARERLIEAYAPLVKYVSGRLALFLPPAVEIDDLFGYGALGLIQAVDRFDPSRGIKFTTFAIARIRGAILDGIRKSDWLPRGLRQKERQLRDIQQVLANRLGRFPTDEEMAAELHMAEEDFRKFLQEISQITLLSLDDFSFEPGGTGEANVLDNIAASHTWEPSHLVTQKEMKRMVAQAIDKLEEKERLVVSLYYYDGFTRKEIAEILGVSESRVSQLHTKAILRLRGYLGTKKRDLQG
jgi:RNA polymerase sigma factor for flagellar operon FliA